MKVISTSNGEFQVGVVFGHPDYEKSDWVNLRIKKNSHEGECAYFPQHFYKPARSTPIPVPNQNHLHLQVWNGKMTAYVNGKLVMKDEGVPEDVEMRNS